MPLQANIPLQDSAGNAIPAGCFNSFRFEIDFPGARLVNQYFISKTEFDAGKAKIKNTVLFDNGGTLEPLNIIWQETLTPAQYANIDTAFIEGVVKNRLEAITGPGTWDIVPY